MPYKIEINQRTEKKIKGKWLNEIIRQSLGEVGVKNAEISLAFVGDAEMKKLNKKWRGKNKVTDVLSFIYEAKPLVGEIIICLPQAARQAGEGGHSIKEEIKTLLVHGLLHLAGYDHEKSLKEAEQMEKLQNKLLKCLVSNA